MKGFINKKRTAKFEPKIKMIETRRALFMTSATKTTQDLKRNLSLVTKKI